MNMFARFDENPAMTLQDIKETKRYGRTDARTDARTDGQRENSIPTTTKFAGGIIICLKKNSRSNIQSVSAVKLLFSIFMSIDTSMTSLYSHLFHVAFN